MTNIELEKFKELLLYKKITDWTSDKLILSDNTVVTIEMTDYDCCAYASGTFENVVLDACITDVVIKDKGNRIETGGGGEHCSYAEVVIFHNRNIIANANCSANDGNGGYYFSVCSLVIEDVYTEVCSC